MYRLKTHVLTSLAAGGALAMFLAGSAPARAEFPPITAEQKALTSVPGEPRAPAVVLFHQGELHFQDLGKQIYESKFTVRRRLKILTEEGLEYGDLVLADWQAVRIKKLEGRTVLPDGRELPLETAFQEKASSRRFDFATTVAAFDGVEVGAILDFEYVVRFESFFNFRPWYFQDRIPTLHSEISYIVPEHLGFRPWGKEAIPGKLQQQLNNRPDGRTLTVWMDDMPSIPDEPSGYPLEDLSSQFLLIITEISFSGRPFPLFETWETTCELYEESYTEKRRANTKAEKKAKELVAGMTSKREQAERLYRFVRDDVRFDPLAPWELTVNSALEQGRGRAIDQALMLQVMLEQIGLDSDLIWTENRSLGRVDMNTANGGWFSDVLVRVEIDGKTYFLNPANRRLGFGHLAPGHQGMDALVVSRKKPQPLTLPDSASEDNQFRARLDLTVGDGGAVGGQGELTATGTRAYSFLRWRDTADETATAWQERLEKDLADFAVSEVQVEEAVDEGRVTVRFKMAQLEDTVLEDEVSLKPSRPLGPLESRFKSTSRRTPVLLSYTTLDDLEVALHWGDGWELEAQPAPVDFGSGAGLFSAGVSMGEDGRSARYQRRLEVTQREYLGVKPYEALQQLFQEAETHDQQSLVLVRR